MLLRNQVFRASSRLVAVRGFSQACRGALPRGRSLPITSYAGRSLRSAAAPGSLGPRRYYSPLSTDQPAEEYKYDDVKKLTQNPSTDVVLVDVREPSEYEQGSIPGAINIPFKSSPGALGLDGEDFYDTFGVSKPSLDQKLVFYCLAGVRSTGAEQLAATYGYQKRGNYVGSYDDWMAHESK